MTSFLKPPLIIIIEKYMYINHVTRIVWIGVQFRWFGVMNGVKQGEVLSPVLFCQYRWITKGTPCLRSRSFYQQ